MNLSQTNLFITSSKSISKLFRKLANSLKILSHIQKRKKILIQNMKTKFENNIQISKLLIILPLNDSRLKELTIK